MDSIWDAVLTDMLLIKAYLKNRILDSQAALWIPDHEARP